MEPEGGIESRINVTSRTAGFDALVGAKKPLTKLIVPLILALGVAVPVKVIGEPVRPESDAVAV